MTAPIVVSRTTTVATGSGPHAIDFPATVNAGDLLIAVVAAHSNTVTADGFQSIRPHIVNANMGGQLFWREADGTEGGDTFTVTSGVATSVVVLRITGHADPWKVAPYAVHSTGNTANPDPPSVTHPFGTQDYLWLATCMAPFNRSVNAYPSNYSNGTQAQGSSATAATAERAVSAATEDPGTFTISASTTWVSFTIVVAPEGETFTSGFPTVAHRSRLASTAGSPFAVPYPNGIEAGDLLVCVCAQDNINTDLTFPAGWTTIVNGAVSNQIKGVVAWKKAAGTETGTFNVTSASGTPFTAQCLRIVDAVDPDVTPPIATSTTGTSSTPDPPNNDRTISGKYLWLATASVDGPRHVTVWPTGYLNGSDLASTLVSMATSVSYEEASAEDPGAFTFNSSEEWVAGTIAIRGDEFVRSRAESDESSATTSHVVDLPATVEAGDRLVVAMSFDLNGTALSVSNAATLVAAGWEFHAATSNGTISALLVMSKTAVGNEDGTTVTVQTTGSYVSNHASFAVKNQDAVEAATPATGVSATPDPPSISPTWGTDSRSFLMVFSGSERRFSDGAAPTGYQDYGENITADTRLMWASKVASTASEDPGAFGAISSSDQWVTVTLAFQEAEPAVENPSGTGSASLVLSATGTGSRTARGSASANLAVTATGSGLRTAQGTGTASLVLSASAVGDSGNTATGTANLVLTATAAGVRTAQGTGTASLAVTATGTGSTARTGAGSAALALSATGTGLVTHVASGAANVVVTATGTGVRIGLGSGTAVLNLAATGVGVLHHEAEGTAGLVLAATGEAAIFVPFRMRTTSVTGAQRTGDVTAGRRMAGVTAGRRTGDLS